MLREPSSQQKIYCLLKRSFKKKKNRRTQVYSLGSREPTMNNFSTIYPYTLPNRRI